MKLVINKKHYENGLVYYSMYRMARGQQFASALALTLREDRDVRAWRIKRARKELQEATEQYRNG